MAKSKFKQFVAQATAQMDRSEKTTPMAVDSKFENVTLEPSGIQTPALDWSLMNIEQAAAVFIETFDNAYIMPNAEVLEILKETPGAQELAFLQNFEANDVFDDSSAYRVIGGKIFLIDSYDGSMLVFANEDEYLKYVNN